MPLQTPLDAAPSSASEPDASPPHIGVTLNGILLPINELLVVPPSGFVVHVGWQATDAPVDPASLSVLLQGWDGTQALFGSSLDSDGVANAWMTWQERRALTGGSYTLEVSINDVNGVAANASYSFAVRQHSNGKKPIGTGQAIFFDFEADRDSKPGPDFDGDLEAFGLRSAQATAAQNEWLRDWVISAVLERIRIAYKDSNPAGLPTPDPIEVSFFATDPGTQETTRICVGGEDPSGGAVIANVRLDHANADRASQECANLPPTGVFPREFLSHYSGQAAFKQAFDPLRPEASGTPIGAHAHDAIVLAPDFDPLAPGTPPVFMNRFVQVRNAVESLGASLGTLLAHETGHALGLVPGGAPGGGLHGGGSGPDYAHNVEPDGSKPKATYIMNRGDLFSYAELAGAEGEPFAEFRAINHAYLRDRVVLDSRVTRLLPPPSIASVEQSVVAPSFPTLRIEGAGFAATPNVIMSNAESTYHAIGEQFSSEGALTAGIARDQVAPGIYDVGVENPDGQIGWLPEAVTIE